MSQHAPVVMIVGGGFGGLAAAGTLKKEPVKVILFDRTNHHLFQPFLYQVATSVFAPGQIGLPLRAILRSSDNTMVILGELTGVDTVARQILVDNADRKQAPLLYDYLILSPQACSAAILDMKNLRSTPQA
jgi:NADH:ubiquinone reductase (H+-translocating)